MTICFATTRKGMNSPEIAVAQADGRRGALNSPAHRLYLVHLF
jgi:hypothetical protein